jgi:glycosyltransferase involved in cell wall biosynthesis
MKYSLIIPAYKAEKTIAYCLDSALTQSISREEYEIIVVDDGSIDNTCEIVKSYPVVLIQQQNQGPASARNKGVQNASGSILIFTDSDCDLDRNFLERMVSSIEQGNGIVGVQGCYKTRQKAFMAQFGQTEIETRYKIMAKNKYIDFIGTYAAAYKKDIFLEHGGFDTGFSSASGEDTEFSYKLHRNGNKMIFNPLAFVYHQHPSKLSHYLKTKFHRGYWRVRLYRKHPKKIVKDSYTPQSLKFQVLSIPLIFFFGILSVFNKLWTFPLFVILVSFLLFSIQFLTLFQKQKSLRNILIPVVLFLRATSLFFGMIFGVVDGLWSFIYTSFINRCSK